MLGLSLNKESKEKSECVRRGSSHYLQMPCSCHINQDINLAFDKG